MVNLGRYIARSARYWGNRPAIVSDSAEISFRELDRRTNRLANALRGLGLIPGDRVAVYSGNRLEMVETEFALYKAGLVRVTVNARLVPTDALEIVVQSGARGVVADGDLGQALAPLLRDAPDMNVRLDYDGRQGGWSAYETVLSAASDCTIPGERQPDDLAVIHFTSGSTGKPRGIMQTFGNRLSSLRKFAGVLMQNLESGDRFALTGPLSHASGMFNLPLILSGCTIRVFSRFDAGSLASAMREERIAGTFVVPTMLYRLLELPAAATSGLHSLKQVVYGAAPTAPNRVAQAMERLGPVMVQLYGAGEVSGVVAVLTARDHIEAVRSGVVRLSSCGRAISETEVSVTDDHGTPVEAGAIGEICVRGDDVFAGYWNDFQATAEAVTTGWWHSGDLARIDDEGFMYVVDRKKDMIISGGFNVYPTEVETVLFEHAAVREVCVVGVPDPEFGESVKAVVVKRPGASVSEEELVAFAAPRLGFKKPKSVDFVDVLPRTTTGKIARREVRTRYWEGRDRKVG